MNKQKTFDPYNEFTKLSTQWEKELNDMFRLNSNNEGFLRFAIASSDSDTLYKEYFNKYQEIISSQLNLSTKNDVANIAALSVQTEEKIDSLEEQIWKLQHSVQSTNKEIEAIEDVAQEIVKLTKQLKSDVSKTKVESSDTKVLRKELQEMKKELEGIHQLKEELSILMEMMNEKNAQQTNREPELFSNNSK